MKTGISTAIVGVLLILTALSLTGCATNAATGKSDLMLVSEEQESKLSLGEHEQFIRNQGLYSDNELQDYVQRVGKKIVRVSDRENIDYHFFVLNNSDINAFALPNGYIYVTRGLLAYLNTEAELAAVLSHEVAHVAARHSAQLMSSAKVAGTASTIVGVIAGIAVGAATGDINLAQSTMNLTSNVGSMAGILVLGSYSREHELEADQLGARYLARAGYPQQAMVTVLDVFKNIEKFEELRLEKGGKKQQIYHQAFATHPALMERMDKVTTASVTETEHAQETSRTDYLQNISGLVFEVFDETRPAPGVLTTWINREALFQIYLPPEWKVIESSNEGVSLEKSEDLVRTDIRLLPPQSNHDPEQFFSGPQVGATHVKDVKTLSHVHHKMPTFSAFADLKKADAVQTVYVSVMFHEKYTVHVTGTHKDPAWLTERRYAFDAQTNLTKILSQEEYDQQRVKRIKIVNARDGDSYSSFAMASPLGAASENYLRLINHQYPVGEPVVGQSIKIVTVDE